MALFVASLANVSWQGINPPGAGGDPLDYPATTFAVPVVVWSPTPVDLPEARVSPRYPVTTQTPLGSWSACPCFDPRLAQTIK